MVGLSQGEVMQNKASSIQNGLAGTEVLHSQDHQTRDLANHLVQLLGEAIIGVIQIGLVVVIANIDS
jgi:hypothetical protein